MGQRGPVALAEVVDRSAGIAGELVELLKSDPAVRSRPSIEAAIDLASELRELLARRR